MVYRASKGRFRATTVLAKPTGFDAATNNAPLSVALNKLSGAGTVLASGHLSGVGTKLGPGASDTIKDSLIQSDSNIVAYGNSNFEGTFDVLRQFNAATDDFDPAEDVLFAQLGEKGVQFWAYVREGKKGEAPWAAGDNGWVYQCVTDEPQSAQERDGNFYKTTIPLSVEGRKPFIVAGT